MRHNKIQFSVFSLQFTMSFQFTVYDEAQGKPKTENLTKTENRELKTGVAHV